MKGGGQSPPPTHTLFCRIEGAGGVALLPAPQFYEVTYAPVTYFCPKISQRDTLSTRHDLYFTSASKVCKTLRPFSVHSNHICIMHKLGAGCEFAHSLYKITYLIASHRFPIYCQVPTHIFIALYYILSSMPL